MSASKRPREDDDDLWGDELDANTVDECFFLASQAMSQNAPTEAHTTKEDAQPTSSLFCKPADTKFKVPQPISHFKPKQRLSDSSSSPSSAFTKKFPSTAPSQLFPKKVSASASQSHTFPQQRQYTPTQLDVHKKSSPNVFPKMVSASKSVTKFPSTSGVLSTSKSSATVRSVTPSWPQPNSAGSSKLPGSSSTDRQPRTSWSASASAGSSCSTETNHVRSMGALSSIGGKMTIPTKPEGNVSLSTPVPEEIDFRMTSTRGTVHMLNTNSFPTAGSSKVPEDNVDTYNELQQLRMAKKKLEEELQTRDGEVAILRTQLNSVKCDLEKQRTLKQQEVEKQASEFKEKMKIMQKELEQKSTLLEFKNLEAVTATERCRLLESNSKVKLVEPQPTQTMETFPENPIPSTSVKEKEEVVNTENKGEKTIGEENTKQKHREKIEFIKSTFGELDHKTKPPPQGWILSSLVKPYIFEKPRNDVVRKPERYNERAPGFNLTPYGVTVYAIHPVLSQLLRQEDLDDFESRALIDQMIWKCYLLLQVQMTYLKKNMVHIDKSIADCLDANLFQETGKVYRNEKVHIMSARKWFKDEQSIEIRRIFGLMAALASVSDYAATYMTGNIREKLWVNTMCMKHLRFSHELIRARNQYISALNKLGPKPEPTKNETKMTEKEELQRKKMLEHVEDLRMTAQFENSLKDLKQLRKAWIFLLEHFQQFEDIINGKPVELDPETEDKLSKEMDYWIDYFKRRGRLGALIKRHKRNIRKAKIAKKLPKPKKVVKRKRKSKPKNQLFVQKCKKSIKRWTATKYPKPPTEQELDDELQVLDLEREDWINVDPYMESDEPFSPAAYLRNYVIKCRKMGRFANLNAFDSLKPKPSTSQPAKKRSRRLKIELDTDSDDADSNQTAISSEQGTSIFKKPRPPLAPSPHKKVKKPCDSDDPHNNESARSSEQGTCTFKKPPRPALAPSPHKKVKKPHESDDADNNQRAISSEQVTSTFKKPPPRPPLAPSPHKKKVKDGYLHYIHPMKWNLISIDEVRKAMNNGGQFDMKKATYTPLLKDSIDNSIESLLPSPLQKIKLRMELKENPISKGRQILKHPLWIPQFVPDLVIQKIENLTPEELEYYKKPGEPHWQGPKVDFFQFLCDMIQIIADQRWTVTCNGILFGVTHLVKVIVSHTEIKEERCEVLTKLIKELLLCRPSINVLTELLVLLYRLGHVKTIQENLCIGAGPDPYLQGRFGLVHFHKGLPRMDMCHKQEDVYYFYRTKSCMISLITFMVTLRRIDDIEWYYRTGMAMLMWMSTSSSVSPNGVHWIGPFIDKEMRDCQCRARIIEALIITMHTIYEYVAKYDFKPRHKEDKLFPDLKDFLGTAVRFIKKQAYLDNDTGLLMTNREGQYQEVVRGLWENVDEIDFGIDERKALKILNDLEDQVDGNPPELEMTDEGEEIMGTITNKIMSFLKKKSIENTREIMSKKRHSLKMTPKVHSLMYDVLTVSKPMRKLKVSMSDVLTVTKPNYKLT